MTGFPQHDTAPADIVALDFETANRQHAACSAGIVAVRDGQVVLEEEILINPEVEFDPSTIAVHGITEAQVLDAPLYPTFHQIFTELLGPQTLVLAHNASFDLGVVRKSCDRYGLPYPTLSYLCTLKLAEAYFAEVPRCSLDNLARLLGFPLQHHNALDDARACLGVYHSVAEGLANVGQEVGEFMAHKTMALGSLFPGGYRAFKGGGKAYQLPAAPPEPGPLTGKSFCVLGEPTRYTLTQLRKILTDRGAELHEYFSPAVEYLVVGKKGFFDTEADFRAVIQEARTLTAAGNITRVVTEEAFADRLTEILGAER